jgi:predicted enzyme related to lactoylglutathione lyase
MTNAHAAAFRYGPRAGAAAWRLGQAIIGAGALIMSLALTGPARAEPPSKSAIAASPELGTVWWAELVTKDLKQASSYYSAVIGWTTKSVAMTDSSRPAGPNEPELVLFMTEGNELAGALLANRDTPGKGAPRWIIYFQVADVDAAVQRAIAKGGKLLIHPFDVGTSVRLAVVEDPDGVPFGLATPK